MKYEIITLQDVRVIGMSKEIAFNNPSECAKFHKEWLPAHPEFKWADNACCMEWYCGTDISSLEYQCGIMMPLAD